MKISTIYLSILLGVLVLSVSSCRDRGPDPPPPPPPGKENFTWTVDTIATPGSIQTLMTRFCGFSSSDIFVTGHNARNVGQLYRYDGTHWQQVSVNLPFSFDFADVKGDDPKNLWAVGSVFSNGPNSPLIAHYTGSSWVAESLETGKDLAFLGAGRNPVFAGGGYGTLYKRNGEIWHKVPTPPRYWFASLGIYKTDTLALSYNPPNNSGDNYTVYYFMKWTGSGFAAVDSFEETENSVAHFGKYKLFTIGDRLYSVGAGVFVFQDFSWKNVLETGDITLTGIYGTRLEHLFVVGVLGTAYHFNGVSWKQLVLPNASGLLLTDVWATEEEVFIVGNDGTQTYIYHGK